MWLIELVVWAVYEALKSRRVDMFLMLIAFAAFAALAVAIALSDDEQRWSLAAIFAVLSAVALATLVKMSQRRS